MIPKNAKIQLVERLNALEEGSKIENRFVIIFRI